MGDGHTPKLALRNVHQSYGDNKVLKGIDLEVNEHEVVCMIGSSGCGKSTLLRCVDLLTPIDSGVIAFDGVDITVKGTDTSAIRRRIGIVFQAFNLFPHMTILDNVTLGSRKALGIPRTDAEEQGAELLDRFGLADQMHSFPNRVSGGQKQRAAIARALMGNPEILLLDEVTSALDPELVGDVLAVIRDLAERGLTMVLATHEMGFAREAANRVCFLHQGAVLEEGTPGELFESPQEERTQRFLTRVRQAGRL
ncbi:MAG: amino acid ABC transporter ATP-binding protein [Actinomycetota bacterium]